MLGMVPKFFGTTHLPKKMNLSLNISLYIYIDTLTRVIYIVPREAVHDLPTFFVRHVHSCMCLCSQGRWTPTCDNSGELIACTSMCNKRSHSRCIFTKILVSSECVDFRPFLMRINAFKLEVLAEVIIEIQLIHYHD